VGEGRGDFAQSGHARDVRELRLRLAQGLGGDGLLGDVPADHERGLDAIRRGPQGREGHHDVVPALGQGEPCGEARVFSFEGPVEVRLDHRESVHPHDVADVPAHDPLCRQTPRPRGDRIDPLQPVILSDDGHGVG
jgi:hypothetical protein